MWTSEEYHAFMKSPDRIFPLVTKNPRCPVIRKIHGLKQAAVDEIYAVTKAEYSDVVKRLIIFGSAVTIECWQGSDLDICIDWFEPFRDEILLPLPRNREFVARVREIVREKTFQGECDILYYNDNDGSRVFKDMNTLGKGVVIYG